MLYAGSKEALARASMRPWSETSKVGDAPLLRFKRHGGSPVAGNPIREIKPESSHGDGGPFYRCRFCRAKITTAAWMIEVNGSHRHVFANPYGKVFEIGCFTLAPGCISQGVPTTECSWFAGCSWCFSLCASCFSHLGWKYSSALAAPFFGLIMANLLQQ